MANIGYGVVRTLRRQMFNHLQKLSLAFYDRNEVGRIMSRILNDVGSLENLLSNRPVAGIRRFDYPRRHRNYFNDSESGFGAYYHDCHSPFGRGHGCLAKILRDCLPESTDCYFHCQCQSAGKYFRRAGSFRACPVKMSTSGVLIV